MSMGAAGSSTSLETAARAALPAHASCRRDHRSGTAARPVPAYTAPSAALTASEKTPGSGSAQSTQLRPPSRVRRTPCARKPAYKVSGSSGSTARHYAPLPARKNRADPPVTGLVKANDSVPGRGVKTCHRPKSTNTRRAEFEAQRPSHGHRQAPEAGGVTRMVELRRAGRGTRASCHDSATA